MGNIGVPFDYPYNYSRIALLRPTFEALQLKRGDVRKLYDMFCLIDKDHDGSITMTELMDHLSDSPVDFRARIFQIFDGDHSKAVDFREFVISLWNYCTLSRATLDLFAFDLYDTDGSGEISLQEMTQMFYDLYGKHADLNPQAKRVMTELAKERGTFNIAKFREFMKKHPAMLFPAFQLQHGLRQRVLGVRFWERASNRRLEVCKGRHVPVSRFLELNIGHELHVQGDSLNLEINPTNQRAQVVLENMGTLHYRTEMARSHDSDDEHTVSVSISTHKRLDGILQMRNEGVEPVHSALTAADSPATSPSKPDDVPGESTPKKPKRYQVPEARDQLQVLQSEILHSTHTTFLSPVAAPSHGHGHAHDHSPSHDTVGLVRRHPGRSKDQHENHHEIVVARHHVKHQSDVITLRHSAPKHPHSSTEHAEENKKLSDKIESELKSVQQERAREEGHHGRHSGHHSHHSHHSHDRRQTL